MNPKETIPMTSDAWQKITSLPAGGTISGISSGAGAASLWLCSPAGIFSSIAPFSGKNSPFVHHVRGIPFSSASAVLCVGKTVLAAGYPNQIVRSADGGRLWFSCWTDGTSAPVICFAASPDFQHNATLLAGSDGDGILRSTDGGNSWQLANFGLRSFNILDIAWAPAQAPNASLNAIPYHYEIVFAATDEGVYQSPNAGRAWRFAGDGLPPAPVLCVAVSPDFKVAPASGAVFAGTDGAGLYRSMDGGKSWQAIASFPGINSDWEQVSVNTLYFDSKGVLYAGTSDQGILASSDLGETWRSVLQIDDVILRLAGHGTRLLAGALEQGLLVSNDDGETWQIEEELSARQVTQMAALAHGQAGASFLVAGYVEGAWVNSPTAMNKTGEWQRVSEIGAIEQPIIALLATHGAAQKCFLALSSNYLRAAQDPLQAWTTLFETSNPLTTLACSGEEIVLGSLNGEIWHSPDGGAGWEKLPVPWRNARILALQVRQSSPHLFTIYAVTGMEGDGMMALWRTETTRIDWKPLYQERANGLPASLVLLPAAIGNPSDQDILLAAGTEVFIPGQNDWRRQSITKADAPVLALLSLAEANIVLLSKPGGLFMSRDRGATWEEAGLPGCTITALSEFPDQPGKALALTSNGAIFERQF